MADYERQKAFIDALDKLQREAKRRTWLTLCGALVVLIAIGAGVERIDGLLNDLVVQRITSVEPASPLLSYKKDAAELPADADVIEPAETAVLGSISRAIGGAEVLQTLGDFSVDWPEYASQLEQSSEFATTMTLLRAAGIVDFGGADFSNATLTARGLELVNRNRPPLALSSPPAADKLASPRESTVELIPDRQPLAEQLEEAGENWYRLVISSPEAYIVRTQPVDDADAMDTVVRLFDEGDMAVGYDDDGGRGRYSELRAQLERGVYRLGVTSYNDQAGEYQLSVVSERVQQAQQRIQRDRWRASAERLTVGGMPVNGIISDGENEVAYRLDIANEGWYTIRTSEAQSGGTVDTVVRLHGQDAEGDNVIAVDDDSGGGTLSLLREFLEPGIYYVWVSSFWKEPGPFAIAVEQS